MYSNATGPTQTYAALVYGAVLSGLFSVSTVFHCVAAVSNEGLVLNKIGLISCQSHNEIMMSLGWNTIEVYVKVDSDVKVEF